MLEASQINLTHSFGQAVQITGFHKSSSTPCLTLATKVEEEYDANPRIEIIGGQGASEVRALVVDVAIAMASGIDPVPVSSGLGGAYLLSNKSGRNIAVVKPVDEEPLAFNNPKGFAGKMFGQPGLKRSVRVGETGIRELAAYLLDHDGFAGVHPTALVKISHVKFHVNNLESFSMPPYKIASLQRFVSHDCDAGDLGSSMFSVSSVHRIGILDVRLLNIDRHSGNILVRKRRDENRSFGSADLVPIDHGLCLPEWLDDPYFEWLHWPQASVPFSESELEYISNLDPFQDAKILRNELPCLSKSSIRVLIVCTIFLKKAAASGLSLGDIGEMMTRDCYGGGDESMSILENVCAKARDTFCSNIAKEEYEKGEQVRSMKHTEVLGIDDGALESSTNMGPPSFTPMQIPRFPPMRSKSGRPDLTQLLEEDYQITDSKMEEEMETDNGGSYSRKVSYLTRSVSFAVSKNKNETGDISFGNMNEEEWESFLGSFEKLLPKVFETRKSIGLVSRLGTSCRF